VREALKYRVVNGKKEGLDGRNRLRACADLGINCPEERVSVEDSDVEDYIDSLNLHRRHLTREQRQERVLRLRAKGRSIRDIADTVGVSPSTVHSDIKDAEASSAVQNRTAEDGQPSATSPKTIAGRDGKKHPSRKKGGKKKTPKEAEPCQRCFRIRWPSCDECRKNFPQGFPAKFLRQPGDDGDDLDKPKNGQPKPTFKAALDLLAPLMRHVEELRKTHGHSAYYEAIDGAERTIAEQLHAWQKEGGDA
jgi:hypothetical protein